MLKKLTLLILLSLLLTSSLFAEFNVKNAIEAYNYNLNSSSIGVVESSLMYIAKLKIENPDANFGTTVKKINSLLSKKPGMTLHYKLYITKMLLKTKDIVLNSITLPKTFEPSEFFINISSSLIRGYSISYK